MLFSKSVVLIWLSKTDTERQTDRQSVCVCVCVCVSVRSEDYNFFPSDYSFVRPIMVIRHFQTCFVILTVKFTGNFAIMLSSQ